MTEKVDLEELFGEDEDVWEIISLIRHDDYEEATNVKDELSYNSGWYNYSTLTFDYKGKRYSIEYKEHTSDNVCDFEYTSDLVCLGNSSEMEESVSQEEVSRLEIHYKNQIERLMKEQSKLKQKASLIDKLRLPAKDFTMITNIFLKEKEDRELTRLETVLGDFFTTIAEMKNEGKL